MGRNSFNSVVQARTRCSKHILETPDLLAAYEQAGGLAGDLDEIAEAGTLAEACNLLQSQATADSGTATAEIARGFLEMKREHGAVMSVVQAVINDLRRAGGSPAAVAQLEGVLANEARVQLSTVEKDGVKKRKATHSVSREAWRIEVEKDAGALLALTDAHALLARRRVDLPRLEALRVRARGLDGKLATRAVKRGSKAAATLQEREAVERQSRTWAACHRILAAVGDGDPRVAALLRDAKRSG